MCSVLFADNAGISRPHPLSASALTRPSGQPLAALSGLLCLALLVTSAAPAVAQPGKKDKKTIAVLYFDYNGKSEEQVYLRKALAHMLIADLAGTPGVTIVERTRIEEVYAELDLAGTKRIDKRTALKMGKLLSAHYLVMGSYWFDSKKGRMFTSAHVTHVETGSVLAGLHNRREGEAFFELEQHLAKEITRILRDNVIAFADERLFQDKLEKNRRARKRRARLAAKKVAKQVAVGQGKGKGKGKSTSAVGGGKPAGENRPTLTAKQAARYGRALDALDRGDEKAARADLKRVVNGSPDFDLATIDLASLAK